MEHKYLENYEAGLFDDKIMLEVVLQLDPFKTISRRSSEGVLTFLAKLGGFKNALNLIVGWIGSYFSGKLFMASISKNLYKRKLSKSERK